MIEFLYKGQKCFTNNLPKKLKRMKITKDDIEILREFDETEKKVKPEDNNNEFDDWIKVVYWDPITNYTHIGFTHGMNKPDKNEFFKNSKWNEETKTGLKYCTKEWIDNVVLLNGIPKYPIVIGDDGKPVLETKYNW